MDTKRLYDIIKKELILNNKNRFNIEFKDGFFDERIEMQNIGRFITVFPEFGSLKVYVSAKNKGKLVRLAELRILHFDKKPLKTVKNILNFINLI